METLGGILASILKLFSDNNGWMFWCATSTTLWFVWSRTNEEIILYFAIFSTIIFGLITLKWVKEIIKKKKIRSREIKENEKRVAHQNVYFKNIIWKFFAVVDEDYLKGATQLLDFKIIEGNEEVRFIPRDKQNDRDIWKFVWSIVCHMRIPRELGDNWELIRVEQIQDGCFLHFEPYFLDLLKHYKLTGIRELL